VTFEFHIGLALKKLNGTRIAGIIVGVLLILSGGTFALQGAGIVPASFMFKNLTWIYIGSFSLLVGIVLVLISSFLFRSTRKISTNVVK
jgi:hypothetical protein